MLSIAQAWTDKTNADYCLLFAKFSDCIAILSIVNPFILDGFETSVIDTDFSFGTSLYMNLVSFWNVSVQLACS
ncbi:hypothetical protein SO694_00056220 [Aureococcus anophagefferens]|uniref:Uncharacterized protein n=1 Tax=Aureococcus anophagefferens TaxID=44056 RepID=A0ABR1FXG4_AURAN|nr:hypothetical protein JL721_6763 [Aureococcus anophagefferens]